MRKHKIAPFAGFPLAAILALLPLLAAGRALAEPPLLVPNKTTIYQRVIVHPDAFWHSEPDAPRGDALDPFTVLYVYERREVNGLDWLLCAPNSVGRDKAWLRADITSEFNKAMVLLFTQAEGRKPMLFFKSYDDLLAVGNEPNVNEALDRIERQFKGFLQTSSKPPADFPVVAMEPDFEKGTVPKDHFYIIPIFGYDDQTFDSVKLLEVASIDPGSDGASSALSRDGSADRLAQDGPGMAPSAGQADGGVLVAANDAGQGPSGNQVYVAFVIDTTISMAPYIEQCLDITRDFYDRIIQEGQEDRVSLAVVAFRNSTKATPALGYVSTIVSNFRKASDRRSFESALGRVTEAKVSTHSFSEDSLAGLDMAINDLRWPDSGEDGKIIILITDAGPLPSWDGYNSTWHTPESLGHLAESRGIAIVPIHVKTRAGRKNHAAAEEAYRTISSISFADMDNYIDISTDDNVYASETFGTTASTVMLNLENQIFGIDVSDGPYAQDLDPSTEGERFAERVAEPLRQPEGGNVRGPGGTSGAILVPDQIAEESGGGRVPAPKGTIVSSRPNNTDPAVIKAAQIGQRLGYSIRLNYLGSVNEVKAPQVVRSWIADKDLSSLEGLPGQESSEVPTVEVAVLLTKNQLSSLSRQLRVIMEKADQALDTQSRDFFQSILSASAQIVNDPQSFALKPETTLGDMGVMGEFLADLPYQSVIMGKTETDWYNMSAIEQDNFVRVLKSKIELYDQFDKDNKWAKFSGVDQGDWLYRVPLNALP